MAIKSFRATVGTVAVRLDSVPDRDLKPGKTILVRPEGGDIFVGGMDVTVAQGFKIADGDALPAELGENDRLYGIAAADVTVSIMLGGV